jgi:hypothetical protein
MEFIDPAKEASLSARPPLALLVSALLGFGVCACGSSTGTQSASHTASSVSTANASSNTSPPTDFRAVDGDRDNDVGAPYDDKNNNRDLNFGRAANASDRRAVTALVKRYYAAALAEDGTGACSMIYSTLAEAVPEDYGQVPGPLYMRGAKTCPAALVLMFKHFHMQLAAEVPKLVVTRVRLIERHGFAFLGFGTLPERKIDIAREGHAWKIDGIIDSELG